MRGFDCNDPTHGDKHFTGQTDEDIERQVRDHLATAHPEMRPEQATQMVTKGAYDE